MVRLHVLVEGLTEETCVRQLLAPHLGHFRMATDARRVETGRVNTRYTPHGAHPGRIYRGGLVSYAKARGDLVRWMKQDNNADSFFTTMFDLYALPNDFPGYRTAQRKRDPYDKIAFLEDAFAKDIDYQRFVPYLQLHEFEALILAAPQHLELAFSKHAAAIEQLVRLSAQAASPEIINDGNETAPSKRIIKLIPEYQDSKATNGPLVAAKIGIESLRARCPHFDAWLRKLETLSV
jgi:Domain of unknown function (DUF4276)